MVGSRTNFILSSRSWEIGSHPTAVQEGWNCFMSCPNECHKHTHLTHSYILRKDPPPQCEHCQCIMTVRHILVECNHFAKTRKKIFCRSNVVGSFRFHNDFHLTFWTQTCFYNQFKFDLTVIVHIYRVRWVVGSNLHGGPTEQSLLQPVLHDWCNKGRGMCYPVCGMVHIKETLLLIEKSSPCGGSGFPLSFLMLKRISIFGIFMIRIKLKFTIMLNNSVDIIGWLSLRKHEIILK